MGGFISLADAKRHLRVDHDEEDPFIASLIGAASQHIENVTGFVAPVRTEIFQFDGFSEELRLPLRPIAEESIAIAYLDSNGDQASLTEFRVISRLGLTRIRPAIGNIWPATSCEPLSVSVTADLGYAEDGTNCPASILHAARLCVGQWFVAREAALARSSLTEIPLGVNALLEPYRVRRL